MDPSLDNGLCLLLELRTLAEGAAFGAVLLNIVNASVVGRYHQVSIVVDGETPGMKKTVMGYFLSRVWAVCMCCLFYKLTQDFAQLC